MSRRSIPFVILATLTVVTVWAMALSLSSTTSANPVGGPEFGFGGYRLQSPTTEIGAQWSVPAITGHSIDGGASTWIAVQNAQRQFIQIGTVENSFGDQALYNIFWSDVAVGFHPQKALTVNSGDDIKFTMVQTSQGWRLSYDDVTQHLHRTFLVAYGAGSSFDSAQWLQEDPTIGSPANHVAYPTMQAPTFTHLTQNDKAPLLGEANGQVLMTADGVYLVPTSVDEDQFTFENATGAARQYLHDIYPYDVALYPFQVSQFLQQSPSTAVLQNINSTLAALAVALRTQTWPANALGAVKNDEKFVADYQKQFASFSAAPSPLTQREVARFKAVGERDGGYPAALRHVLGLPPPS